MCPARTKSGEGLVCALWHWLILFVLFSSPLTNYAYDNRNHTTVAYDSDVGVPAGYGVVSTPIRCEGKNGPSRNCAPFATFAEFLAAEGVTAPFKSGDIIIKELSTSKGTLEMAAETVNLNLTSQPMQRPCHEFGIGAASRLANPRMRGKISLHHTEHPGPMPASEGCPGQPRPWISEPVSSQHGQFVFSEECDCVNDVDLQDCKP